LSQVVGLTGQRNHGRNPNVSGSAADCAILARPPDAGFAAADAAVATLLSDGGSLRKCWTVKTSGMPQTVTNTSRTIWLIDVEVIVPSAGTLAHWHYTAFSSQVGPVLGPSVWRTSLVAPAQRRGVRHIGLVKP